MTRYEFVQGTSSKFWQYEIRNAELVIEYGRIGAKPQTSHKTFGSAEEARLAAEKLVKEKTGKGYVAIGGGAAGLAVRAEPTPPCATEAPTSYRTFSKEVDLKKVKVGSGDEAYGPGQWPRILWAVVAAGLLKTADALKVLRVLSNTAEVASAQALLAALFAMPSRIKEGGSVQLIENYTLGMDALLMHLAHRAPEVLAEHLQSLPPNIRRALPLVRARLGGGKVTEPSFMDEFAKSYARDDARQEPLVMLREGRLVNEQIDNAASACALAAFYGDVDIWLEKVRNAARLEDGTFKYSSRTKSFFVAAPVAELAKLTSGFFSDDHAREILEARADSAADLVELLALQKDESEARGNIIAAAAAVRYRAEGKAIPAAVARCLTFDVPHGQTDTYIATLRALGRDFVTKKLKSFVASKKAEVRDRAATALAAFYDDEMFRKLCAHGEVTDQKARTLALVGKAGLAALSDALAKSDPGEYRRRFFAEAHSLAAIKAFKDDGFVLEEEPETVLVEVTKAILMTWPVERRHAWLRARLDGGMEELAAVIDHAELCSAELLDRAVEKLLQEDADSMLSYCPSLEAGGAAVERALLRLLSKRRSDKKLLGLLDWMRLSNEARDEASQILLRGGSKAFVALANSGRVFSEETAAAVIAGKPFNGPFVRDGLRSLCAHLDRLAQELKLPVVIAVGTDSQNTDQGQGVRAVIGIEIQHADTSEVQSVEAAALDKALKGLEVFPWSRVQEALPSQWSADDVAAVYCVASGPLAVAKMAAGELVGHDEEGDYDGLIYGVSMGQEEKTTPVRGKLIAKGSYDEEPVVGVELPSLTRAANNNAAFLIASYDY